MASQQQEGGATIRVGTRSSALAVVQAESVVAALQKAHPTLKFEIDAMKTMGDLDKITPLPDLGKGLWTSEFEAKLVANQLDLVVHSAKDMPTALPEGCVLGSVLEREDPRDVVIFRRTPKSADDTAPRDTYRQIADLPAGSIVGTSSVRRMAQLRRRYPALLFKDLRGNIDTRLRKLEAEGGAYDCIILAAAGMRRMDFGARIAQYLDSRTPGGGGIMHAVGQGALGLECRDGDARVLDVVRSVAHMPTFLAVLAERYVMRTLEGGCSVPIGVETDWSDDMKTLTLKATVVSLDGKQGVEAETTQEVSTFADADAIGKVVSDELIAKGAQKILDEINAAKAAAPAAGPKLVPATAS